VELETDLATGKQQSSQLEIKINELQTQLQDRTENLHQLQHQETDLRKQIDENTQAITTLETVLGSHQQELEHWRQKTLDLIQNLTATQGELAQKDHQLQEMVQRQQAMQGHFDQLQSDWNASESGYARSIQEAQQVTVEARQAHHAVEEELDRHRQELLRKHDALEQNQQALALSQDETKDQRHQVLEQQNLAAAQLQQLRRASALLWRLSNIKGVPGTGSAVPTLQLLALLEGYRHSLKRAERLLRGG
jgi:chromosome segregation ATPase